MLVEMVGRGAVASSEAALPPRPRRWTFCAVWLPVPLVPLPLMIDSIPSLNYLAVLVVAVAGFLVGWAWYSPLLFAKPWMAEMKLTPESIAAAKPDMARLFGTSFAMTLLSTFALAVLVQTSGAIGIGDGAALGALVGTLVVGPRFCNGGLWEDRSTRLQAINVGHEIALFTLQGAILGAWR
jgi:hypothetical protein